MAPSFVGEPNPLSACVRKAERLELSGGDSTRPLNRSVALFPHATLWRGKNCSAIPYRVYRKSRHETLETKDPSSYAQNST
jgi:hypothetical protein